MIKILFLFMALGALSSCGKSSSSDKPASHQNQDPVVVIDPVIANDYLQLVNKHRQKLGLRPLINSAYIEEVAMGHGKAMAQGGRPFGHWGWRARCRNLRDTLKGNLCGENVARGQDTPKEVFEAWLNSPPHRELIEGESFTHTGLGRSLDNKGMIYWAQMFLEI